MTQNFVKVSQEHKHIVVKNAGGLRGLPGPQGPQGIQGPQGPAGPQGIQGVQGPAGEAGPAGPQGIQGVQGEKGDTGATGPQGPQGPAGAGLVITGSVDTYAELPSTLGPSDAGKAYFVQADGKLYVWTGTAWPAEGEGAQFEGPQGPTGATGATGATGPAGADGYSPTATVAKSGDTATITITDKNGTTTAQVSDGANGAPGADGFSPIATVSKSGTTTTISITDEQGTTTATVNDGVIPTIDSALSTSSENPVQNKVITTKLNDAAFVGTEVVGGTSLIDTSDIAPSAITTTKIADGAVTSSKIDWTTIEFSSSETLVGSWLDGKPVYQKTSTIPMAAANTWYYGDYTENIKQIVFLDGVIVTGSGGVFPLNNSNSTVAIAFDPNDTTHKAPQVRTTSTGIFPATVYLQFKYTKTTD